MKEIATIAYANTLGMRQNGKAYYAWNVTKVMCDFYMGGEACRRFRLSTLVIFETTLTS